MDHYVSVEEYIAQFSPTTQLLLLEIREAILELVPRAEEVISYGIPTYKFYGNLVHFGGYKNHVGFYPGPSGLEAFRDEVDEYKNGKGSVQFPIDKPLPMTLIKKIISFRMAENEAKSHLFS
jgi:uncharacterized protein YdhG (YjbR/CyaY superfamily)